MRRGALLASLLTAALSGPALACSAPPWQFSIPAANLVAGSESIVLGTVSEVRGGERGTVYVFQTVKVVKGNDLRKQFEINGSAPLKQEAPTFANHTEKSFWQAWGGRMSHGTDCRIHPYFRPGETYLIFFTAHNKAYERIADPREDRWLKWVESAVWKAASLEEQAEATAQAEKRAYKEREARDAQCVIAPVMSDADMARCRR